MLYNYTAILTGPSRMLLPTPSIFSGLLRRGYSAIPSIFAPSKSPAPPAPKFNSEPRITSETLAPQVLIQCLPNNIFMTVSSHPGSTILKLSSGLIGMKNAQKTSQKAAMALVDTLAQKLKAKGINSVRLNFRGINSARPLIVSQLRKVDMHISEVTDTTGIPFNGCRPKKTRRV